MAQKILTRSQLSQSAPPGIKRKLIGTYIKEEDKKPKIEQVEKREEEFYQNELTKLQQRKQNKKTKSQWPKDARLVHIVGSQCSDECMKTSRYHMDPTEMQQESSSLPISKDPRNVRPMGEALDGNLTDQHNTDNNNLTTSSTVVNTENRGTSGKKSSVSTLHGSSEQSIIPKSKELDVATNKTMSKELTDLPKQDTE